MAIRLASDTSRVVAFPGGQLERPSIELLARLAPSRSLVDTLIAERGLECHDARAGMAREMTYQDAARICRAYQDAADRLLCREVEVAQAGRVTAPVRVRLAAARNEVHGRAIAARIVADAAQGAAAALATYIREGCGGPAVSHAEPRQLLLFGGIAD